MRASQKIVTDINNFKPEHGDWRKLDNLLDELWVTGEQQKYARNLFNLFERFPEDHGAGVLWSVVHGIETFDNYEKELLESLNRQPSEMGVVMLRRIVNSGTKVIAGLPLNRIVADLINNTLTPESVRQDVKDITQ
jgi:hypothetical protein